MNNDDLHDIQAEAIKDLEIKLKDLQFLLDECRPWMENGETPAQCIQRNRDERMGALHRESAMLDRFLALKKGLRHLLGSVE